MPSGAAKGGIMKHEVEVHPYQDRTLYAWLRRGLAKTHNEALTDALAYGIAEMEFQLKYIVEEVP